MSFPIPVLDPDDPREPVVDPEEPPPGTLYGVTWPLMPIPEGVPMVVIAKQGWERERN